MPRKSDRSSKKTKPELEDDDLDDEIQSSEEEIETDDEQKGGDDDNTETGSDADSENLDPDPDDENEDDSDGKFDPINDNEEPEDENIEEADEEAEDEVDQEDVESEPESEQEDEGEIDEGDQDMDEDDMGQTSKDRKCHMKDLNSDIIILDEDDSTTYGKLQYRRVPDDQRETDPIMTFYEMVRIIGTRCQQFNFESKPLVAGIENIHPAKMAYVELISKMTPYIIRRHLPGKRYEDWKIDELEIVHTITDSYYVPDDFDWDKLMQTANKFNSEYTSLQKQITKATSKTTSKTASKRRATK